MLLKDMSFSYCVRHNFSPMEASAFLISQSLTATTSASSFPRTFESLSAHTPDLTPYRLLHEGYIMPSQELNLLSLDGGGVRGLSSLYILQRLMEAVNPEKPPKPCDYFDMIAGTSTGG